jgi:hypothetical protein
LDVSHGLALLFLSPLLAPVLSLFLRMGTVGGAEHHALRPVLAVTGPPALTDKEPPAGLVSAPAERSLLRDGVGPLAEGQWMGEDLERPREIDWDVYGSREDFKNARIIADVTGAGFDSLLREAVHFLTPDKIKLAIERVADALVDRHTLITTDVNKLVFGNVRGAQQ